MSQVSIVIGCAGDYVVTSTSGQGKALLIWRTGERFRERIDALDPTWMIIRFAPPFRGETGIDHFVDVTGPLPFPDRTFDFIYARRILEHLAPDEAKSFITELARTLNPGGVLRVTVPDHEADLRAYLAAADRATANPTDQALIEVTAWRVLVLDQFLRRVPGGALARLISAGRMPENLLRASYGEALGELPRRTLSEMQEPVKSLRIRIGEVWRLIRRRRWILAPQAARESHVALWDRVTLPLLLTEAGFRDVAETSHRDSCRRKADILTLDLGSDGQSPFEPALTLEAVTGDGT